MKQERDITGQMRTEEALIEERHLLHTLMDNLPDAIYFKDRESRFTRINLAHATLFGLSHPDQAVGKSDLDFFTAEHAQEAYRDEQEIMKTGKPMVGKEERETWPDGRVTWVSTTKMPLRDPNGDIIGTFGISRDVTQRKQAEEALGVSEGKYRSLVSNIPDVVWTVDDKLRFTFISKNIEGLSGYSLEEVYKEGANLLLASLHPDDVHNIREGFRGLITAGQPFDVECRLKHKRGEWIWVHDRAIATYEKDGIRYATGLLSDITERKRAEEHTRLQTAALESAANGIVIANLEGNIIWVNRAFTRLTGYPASEVIGKNPRVLKSGVHDKVFYQDLWDTILSGKVWHGEIVNRRKDGTSYIEEMTITPVRDTQGTITHFIAIKQDITARKRTEESMRESEERFRATFENAGIGVALVDLQGRPIKSNPALWQMLGYSKEALSRMTFTEFTHPDDRELDWGLYTDLAAGKREKYEIEKRFLTKDGGLVWGLLTVSLVKGGDGRPVCAVGMVQDITERKRADAQLATQARISEIFLSVPDSDIYQEILKLLLDNLHSSLGLFGFIDEDGGLEVPSMTREIWHMCQMPWKTTRFPRDTWGESSWGRALKEKRTIYSNELSASTPKGHVHICRNISLPILFHGEAIGLFVVANKETDYTEDDVQALENIANHVAPILSARLQRQHAEAKRDYMASIVKCSNDAIIGITTDCVIQSWNAGAEKLYGYTPSEVVGKPGFLLVPPEHRKEVNDHLNRIKHGEEIEPHETVMVRKDGGLVDVSITISPLKNSRGEVVGASTVARDITAHREIEHMKDELVSVVSHELRTPLTSIRGALGLLAGGLLHSQPEKGKRMLEIAISNTDRLVRLINEILDLERMESGKMNMEKRPCNATDLMTEAADNVRELAEKAGVTLSVSHYPARLWVDPDRLIQAFVNLLSNAIKFSARGGTVWLSATPQADQILFQVKDQGRGIPKEKCESIFERFQQVDASDRREKGGTGLGLPITRSIVQQHGGRIGVDSELGQGSTFSFMLPSLPAETITAGGSAARTVLVCADEAGILSAAQAALKQRGYSIMASPSWQEAMERAAVQRPDAILLDVSLLGEESSESTTAMKEKLRTLDIPVIGLGGAAPDEAHLAARRLAGWVTKPLNQTSLLHALDSVLDKSSEHPRVLVIEDDADLAGVLTTVFERHGAVVFHARTGREAVQVCPQFIPDLLVLDVMLPELDGFGIVERLRQYEHLRRLPVAVYSVKELDDSEKARLRLGESIFMTKSRLTPQEFEQRAIGLLNWATSGQKERRGR